MKIRNIMAFTLSLLLLHGLCSCQKNESTPSVTPENVSSEDASAQNIFDYGSGTDVSAVIPGKKASTDDVAEYIKQTLNISDYHVYDFNDQTDIATKILTLNKELEKNHALNNTVTVGESAVKVSLPATFSSLTQLGFVIYEETDADVQVAPGEEYTVSFYAPSSEEIIGFSVFNNSEESTAASFLPINAVTLTSLNSFSIFGGITGSSDFADVINLIGNPDIIGISSDEYGTSLILDYANSLTDSTCSVFFDGTTKNLIGLRFDTAE